MPKHKTLFSMTLRILGYLEDGQWAAHCLETDLVGFGRNFDAAVKNLMELTEMQVSFAVQTGQRSLLDHPAAPDIWQRYERMAQECLRNFQQGPNFPPNTAIGALPLPSNMVESGGRVAWCGA